MNPTEDHIFNEIFLKCFSINICPYWREILCKKRFFMLKSKRMAHKIQCRVVSSAILRACLMVFHIFLININIDESGNNNELIICTNISMIHLISLTCKTPTVQITSPKLLNLCAYFPTQNCESTTQCVFNVDTVDVHLGDIGWRGPAGLTMNEQQLYYCIIFLKMSH